MGGLFGGMMNPDSVFGQIMTRIWILFWANILFVVVSIPVVTMGPALAALYYVMLKVLRGDKSLSPFKTFFEGLRANFKQGLICWLAFLGIAALTYADLHFLKGLEGSIATVMKCGVLAVFFACFAIMICLMPVMAAFADTIPHLLKHAIFFAFKNPIRLIAMAAVYIVPLAITYLDTQTQPLYAFCWCFFGFSAVVMACSSMLIRDFNRFLPAVETDEGEDGAGPNKEGQSARKTLKEMKKLEG